MSKKKVLNSFSLWTFFPCITIKIPITQHTEGTVSDSVSHSVSHWVSELGKGRLKEVLSITKILFFGQIFFRSILFSLEQPVCKRRRSRACAWWVKIING